MLVCIDSHIHISAYDCRQAPIDWAGSRVYASRALNMESHAPSAQNEDLARRGPALARLVQRLQALPSRTAEAMGEVLRQSGITFDDVRTFIRFDDVNYVRNLVHREAAFEVRVLCWRPGQASALHGHGRSACALTVVRGAATEVVVGQRDRVHPPGAIMAEADPLRVHQLMNCERDSLISLHVYAPPISIDKPSDRRGHEIVVVGGGASGVAAAYHLVKHSAPDVRVNIVERGPELGRGIAYGVESDLFLLNVPASRMSIDPEIPDDFVKYANSEADPHAFLPRSLYGRYLNDRLASVARSQPAKVRVYRDEAVGIEPLGNGAAVMLRSGEKLRAKSVIVATGLSPRITRSSYDPRVIDGWDECALGALPRYGRILILGAGLSALDVLAWLEHISFRGTLRIVSPRGLMSRPHRVNQNRVAPLSAATIEQLPRDLRSRIRWIRSLVHESELAGEGFQSAFDKIRPHVETLYRSMSPRDRIRFMRHVRSYWEIFRHRAPIPAIERVQRLEGEGRLERTAGRVIHEDRAGERIRVRIRTRAGIEVSDEFDAVVRCIGPSMSLKESMTPFSESLLEQGLARVEESGLGLETDREGRLVTSAGASSRFLYGLGAVRRASSWETTSMPDISVHAAAVARACLPGHGE